MSESNREITEDEKYKQEKKTRKKRKKRKYRKNIGRKTDNERQDTEE
jgi:hypothetical protein